jgi:DNA-binding winged helix-turn-helix (wHTH) protein
MIYTFGECVLDTQLHVLSRAQQPVKLRPKAFEVLVYLLELNFCKVRNRQGLP